MVQPEVTTALFMPAPAAAESGPLVEGATGRVPVAEFVPPEHRAQPVLHNGKVFSERCERQVFGPWRRRHEPGGLLVWEQHGFADVRQEDGFVVRHHGGLFRAFGLLGFRRSKVFDPEGVAETNDWASGLTLMTAVLFTEQTQFSC